MKILLRIEVLILYEPDRPSPRAGSVHEGWPHVHRFFCCGATKLEKLILRLYVSDDFAIVGMSGSRYTRHQVRNDAQALIIKIRRAKGI